MNKHTVLKCLRPGSNSNRNQYKRFNVNRSLLSSSFWLAFLWVGVTHTAYALSWINEQLVDEPPEYTTFASRTSIAINSKGWPYISYEGRKYAYYDGSRWKFERAPFLGRADSGVITLDSNDQPHIAFRKDGGLTAYVYFDGEDWRYYDGLAGCPPASMALDASGSPHIVCNYYGSVYYQYLSGEVLESELIQSRDNVNYIDWGVKDMQLDQAGLPHTISIPSIGSQAAYIWHDGLQWNKAFIELGGPVRCAAIALDSGDQPHLALCVDGDLKHYIRRGDDWEEEVINNKAAEGAVLLTSSLHWGNNGRLHIAW